MLSVKNEFCPLDWYSTSPTIIALYKKCTVYMQSVSKQSPKAQKKKLQFT